MESGGRSQAEFGKKKSVGQTAFVRVPVTPFSRTKSDATVNELKEERELVKKLLGGHRPAAGDELNARLTRQARFEG